MSSMVGKHQPSNDCQHFVNLRVPVLLAQFMSRCVKGDARDCLCSQAHDCRTFRVFPQAADANPPFGSCLGSFVLQGKSHALSMMSQALQ
jgi:hypothetical protein